MGYRIVVPWALLGLALALGCSKKEEPRDVTVGGTTFHLPCNARIRLDPERSRPEISGETGCTTSGESRLRLVDSKPKPGADPANEVLFKFVNLASGARPAAPCGEGWISSLDVSASRESWGPDYPATPK